MFQSLILTRLDSRWSEKSLARSLAFLVSCLRFQSFSLVFLKTTWAQGFSHSVLLVYDSLMISDLYHNVFESSTE